MRPLAKKSNSLLSFKINNYFLKILELSREEIKKTNNAVSVNFVLTSDFILHICKGIREDIPDCLCNSAHFMAGCKLHHLRNIT